MNIRTAWAALACIGIAGAQPKLTLIATGDADLAKRLSELEEKTEALAMKRDDLSCTARQQLKQVLDALRALMTPPDPPKRPIGFVIRLTNVRGADLLSASIALEDSQSPDCPALPTGCEQSSNAAPVRRRSVGHIALCVDQRPAEHKRAQRDRCVRLIDHSPHRDEAVDLALEAHALRLHT